MPWRCLRIMRNLLSTLAIALTLAACSTEPSPVADNGLSDSSRPDRQRDVAANTVRTGAMSPPPPGGGRECADARGPWRPRIGQAIPAGSNGLSAVRRRRMRAAPSRPPTSPAFTPSSRMARCAGSPPGSDPPSFWPRRSVWERPRRRSAAGLPDSAPSPTNIRPHRPNISPRPMPRAAIPPCGSKSAKMARYALIHVGTMPVLAYVEGCA